MCFQVFSRVASLLIRCDNKTVMALNEIEQGTNYFDVRSVIERFEELETRKDELKARAEETEGEDAEEWDEFERLEKLLGEIKGNGGDHQWRGDWYPVTFYKEEYFEAYAREFASDVGAIEDDTKWPYTKWPYTKWPYTHIDWPAAALDLRGDYSSVEYGGYTYWYR